VNFYPYGVERPSATANDKEKFTGYFRDASTGLDYADQRYHQPGVGRFMTPDPNGGSAQGADPGSLNRYAYTRGDPVNRVDPKGLDDDFPGYYCGDFCDFADPFSDYGGYPDEIPFCSGTGGNCSCIGAFVLDSSCVSTYGIAEAISWLDPSALSTFESFGVPDGSLSYILPGLLPVAGIGEIGAGAVCVGSGVCEVVGVVILGGEAIYIGYKLGQAIEQRGRGRQGNVGDTRVMAEMQELIRKAKQAGVNLDPCDALNILKAAAQKANDRQEQRRIRTIQKTYGCSGDAR